jgi:cell division protein FtsQ
MKKTSKTKYLKRGKPRRRVISFWRHRHFRLSLVLLLIGLAASGSWQVWQSGWVPDALKKVKWAAIKVSTEVGFKVNDILVVGRSETRQKDLLDAIRLIRGAPILAFDLKAAQKRVESLLWIKKAAVKRMLPDTVLLNVVEHKPLALWQNKGALFLIGTDGEVILQKDLNRFSELLLVVGPDAPKHASKLLESLRTEPTLMRLVKAAVRVGGRRWNLRLEGGIDVRLPEDNTSAAWTRLAEYEKSHQVLERDIRILDLRIPGRLIVRKSPPPPLSAKGRGQET